MKNEISLKELIGIVAKRWWILLTCAILVGALTFMYTKYMIDPVYESKGSLYVNNARYMSMEEMDIGTINASQKLVSTYIEILRSDTFLKKVQSESGINLSLNQIRNMLAMGSANNTEVLIIIARSTNPLIASKIIETMLFYSQEEIMRVVKAGSVVVIDEASRPVMPVSPNIRMNTIIGVLMGIIAGAVIIFLMELFDTRINQSEDLLSSYEIPLLGIIPSLN